MMLILRDRIVRYLSELRFPYLVIATGALFFANVLVPDVLPFADEILLALVTVILSRIKKKSASTAPPVRPGSGH